MYSVHIVSDLVLGLEGANGMDEQTEVEKISSEEQTADQVCFGKTNSEIDLFDSLTSDAEVKDPHLINVANQEWFTNHLSSSMSHDAQPSLSGCERDFHVGENVSISDFLIFDLILNLK